MTDFFEVVYGRRSIRRYRPDPVPQPIIKKLLDTALWAPSAHNRQPWRFAVITTTQVKQDLAAAMGRQLRADLAKDGLPPATVEKDAAHSYQRITAAPVLILLCLSMTDMDTYPDDARQQNEWVMAVQSVALAGQNLLLAAHALGLGACWLCAPLFAQNVVQQTLDLPTDWQPQALITAGYPAETRQKTRRPLSQMTRSF